jgi:hypothetical protein
MVLAFLVANLFEDRKALPLDVVLSFLAPFSFTRERCPTVFWAPTLVTVRSSWGITSGHQERRSSLPRKLFRPHSRHDVLARLEHPSLSGRQSPQLTQPPRCHHTQSPEPLPARSRLGDNTGQLAGFEVGCWPFSNSVVCSVMLDGSDNLGVAGVGSTS